MLKAPDICSICGRDYTGFGNNAEPVTDGRCCDPCNDIVIIRRMAESGHSVEAVARIIWATDRVARYFRGK